MASCCYKNAEYLQNYRDLLCQLFHVRFLATHQSTPGSIKSVAGKVPHHSFIKLATSLKLASSVPTYLKFMRNTFGLFSDMSDNKRFVDETYISRCSEQTLQSDKNGFFLQFANQVVENAGVEWINNVFGRLKTDRERIEIVYQHPGVSRSQRTYKVS